MDNLSQQMCSISLTTLTLCSWNVQKLSETSPEKLTIIADTLRSLNCNVIALQEVSTATAGDKLAECLSTTTSTWSANSHVINEKSDAVKEYSVLLWNNSFIRDVKPKGHVLKPFSRELHYIDFMFNKRSMRIANFHFRARKPKITDGISQKVTNDREQDALNDLFQSGSEYLFAVGDFNCYPMSFDHSTGQMRSNYCQLLHPRMYTNDKQDDCYDNVLVPRHVVTDHKPKPSVKNPVKQDYFDATKNKTRLISDHKPIKVIFNNIIHIC